MWARTVRIAALLLMLGGAAAGAGCGAGSHATAEGRRLEREDLLATVHALAEAESEVHLEAQATKAAWPAIADGLPATLSEAQRARIATAVRESAALRLSGLFEEDRAQALTGPAASIVGDFRSFAGLAMRGWQMVAYTIEQRERGSGVASRFAGANVDLYIESIYDGHFGLAQIGKKLLKAYERLGGAEAFAAALTPAAVQSLAAAYSEASYRLQPHDKVKYGS